MKTPKLYLVYKVGVGNFDETFEIIYSTYNKVEAEEVKKTHLLRGEKVDIAYKPFGFKPEKHLKLLARVEKFTKAFHPFMTMENVFAVH